MGDHDRGRAPAGARPRGAGVEERRLRSWIRCRERPAAPTCTGPPTIASSFLSYQDGWPHLYSIHHPDKGGTPTLLTPGAFMVEHVSLTPDRRFLVYSANTGADRHDIDRRHLFKVPVDGSAPPHALTSGTGLEWSPVVTGDGQTVAFLAIDGAAAAAAGGDADSREASRGRLAARQVPAGFPSAKLVTPEPVTFRSSDGLEIHAQLFKTPGGEARRPALVYVHGGPPRQMLLGFHYMDYYANDYAANQYLASRGFIVLSVNYRLGIGYGHAFHYADKAGARGASEYLDVIAGGRYLQARPDVDAQAHRHLGRIVRRLLDGAGARAQLRRLRRGRGHPRRARSRPGGQRRTARARHRRRRHHRGRLRAGAEGGL